MFMVLQAALAALLTRLGAGTDIPIGTPVAGRAGRALADLVGFFINSLVFRADTSGDPAFTDLLARVRATDLAAYAHQGLPFDRLVEALNPPRSLARHPLFQVMLTLDNYLDDGIELPGLTASRMDLGSDRAMFDLLVFVSERAEGGLDGSIEFATDLFDRSTVEAIAAQFSRLLTAIVRDPATPIGRIELAAPAENLLVGG